MDDQVVFPEYFLFWPFLVLLDLLEMNEIMLMGHKTTEEKKYAYKKN